MYDTFQTGVGQRKMRPRTEQDLLYLYLENVFGTDGAQVGAALGTDFHWTYSQSALNEIIPENVSSRSLSQPANKN